MAVLLGEMFVFVREGFIEDLEDVKKICALLEACTDKETQEAYLEAKEILQSHMITK